QDASLSEAMILDSVFTNSFDMITSSAISSNGAYWGACSGQGEIRVWEAGGYTLHRIWHSDTDMLWILALSPDGKNLAGGNWDGEIKVWDIASGALRWSSGRYANMGQMHWLAFSPDGSM